MNRLARELLRRGKGSSSLTEDLPRSLDALCLSPVRTISHSSARTRARSAGGLLVRNNNSKWNASIQARVQSRAITGKKKRSSAIERDR